MTEILDMLPRAQIARFLPDALAVALNSYHKFVSQEDIKDFAKHHTACKVCIAHIELLLKLAAYADLPDPKAADHSNQIILAAVMQEAQEEVRLYKRDNDDDEDESE